MMYTVIYVDKEDGVRRWKKANNMNDAEQFGIEKSDNDYDLCVSLYDYKRLEYENTFLKARLEQIEKIAKFTSNYFTQGGK